MATVEVVELLELSVLQHSSQVGLVPAVHPRDSLLQQWQALTSNVVRNSQAAAGADAALAANSAIKKATMAAGPAAAAAVARASAGRSGRGTMTAKVRDLRCRIVHVGTAARRTAHMVHVTALFGVCPVDAEWGGRSPCLLLHDHLAY